MDRGKVFNSYQFWYSTGPTWYPVNCLVSLNKTIKIKDARYCIHIELYVSIITWLDW